MSFKNFSEVQQSDEWGKFVTSWRNAILNHAMATPKGLGEQSEVEKLITEVINKLVARNVHQIAFNGNAPDEFTLDNKMWASISPMYQNAHYLGKIKRLI